MSREHAAPGPSDVPSCSARNPVAARPYRDLCCTCNHADECDRPSTPERPIFFCEMFEAYVPVEAQAPPSRAPREPPGKPGAPEYKGLCANCENRDTCVLPRPDGGVWHCQEYR